MKMFLQHSNSILTLLKMSTFSSMVFFHAYGFIIQLHADFSFTVNRLNVLNFNQVTLPNTIEHYSRRQTIFHTVTNKKYETNFRTIQQIVKERNTIWNEVIPNEDKDEFETNEELPHSVSLDYGECFHFNFTAFVKRGMLS